MTEAALLAIADARRKIDHVVGVLHDGVTLEHLPPVLRCRLATLLERAGGERAVFEAVSEEQLELPEPELPELPANPDHAMPPTPANRFGLTTPRRLA